MNEIGIRLAWVLGAVAMGIAATMVLQRQGGHRGPVSLQQERLGIGVYLFTSASCADCESARNALLSSIGASGFVELSWESDPEIFAELGVDAVPATLIVRESDGSTLYPGRPGPAIEVLSP